MKKSRDFASQKQRTFQEEKILYIGQREFGTVYPNDNFVDVVGSDSATTCQIVVLRHKGTGECSLAHFDGDGIPEALADMVKTLQVNAQNNNKNRIEMHIVGGFLDSHNISEDVFMQILDGACQLSVNIDLICACVCALNDTLLNEQHVPKIYGTGVVVSSGEVVPVQQFHCPIPDEILRHVALYNGKKKVLQVYSTLTQEITVKPFQVYYPAEIAREAANLSDEKMLKSFSTSPHCEPANFVEKLRNVFKFLAENQNILDTFFPQGNPRRFKRQDNGDWCLIDDTLSVNN